MAGEAEAERAAVGIIAKMAKDVLPVAEKAFAGRLGRDGLRGSASDILKGQESAAVSTLSAEGRAAAAEVARHAAANEPAITSGLDRVVAGIPGASFAGKEFRLKSENSLLRKVAGDVTRGKTVHEATAGINDAVRYTVTAARGDYSRVANETISRMRDAGFEPVKLTNFWGREGYQGINTVWRDTSGQTFELQFHTPESLEAKEATHTLYEMQRVLPDNDPDASTIQDLQNSVFDLVSRPAGASSTDWGGP